MSLMFSEITIMRIYRKYFMPVLKGKKRVEVKPKLFSQFLSEARVILALLLACCGRIQIPSTQSPWCLRGLLGGGHIGRALLKNSVCFTDTHFSFENSGKILELAP